MIIDIQKEVSILLDKLNDNKIDYSELNNILKDKTCIQEISYSIRKNQFILSIEFIGDIGTIKQTYLCINSKLEFISEENDEKYIYNYAC
jgi:ABC-type phosphate transport system ATPase subunit